MKLRELHEFQSFYPVRAHDGPIFYFRHHDLDDAKHGPCVVGFTRKPPSVHIDGVGEVEVKEVLIAPDLEVELSDEL